MHIQKSFSGGGVDPIKPSGEYDFDCGCAEIASGKRGFAKNGISFLVNPA
jgi:hypothetical protein